MLDLDAAYGEDDADEPASPQSEHHGNDAPEEEDHLLTFAFLDQMERSAYEALWVRAELGGSLLQEAARQMEQMLTQLRSPSRHTSSQPPTEQDLAPLRDSIVTAAALFYSALGERQRCAVALQRKQLQLLHGKSAWMYGSRTVPPSGRDQRCAIEVENLPAAWSPQRADTVARVFGERCSVSLSAPCAKHAPTSSTPLSMKVEYSTEAAALASIKGLQNHVIDGSPIRARTALQRPRRGGDVAKEGGGGGSGGGGGGGGLSNPVLSPSAEERLVAHRASRLAQDMYVRKRAEESDNASHRAFVMKGVQEKTDLDDILY